MANKAYVVWHGKKRGIFPDWTSCKASIDGYKGAKYKGFKNLEAAEKAFHDGPDDYWGKVEEFKSELSPDQLVLIGDPLYPSLSVDAAWNTGTLVMEYRGVDTLTGIEVFRKGPFEEGTQNVGEFLAIVHALAHLGKTNSTIPVYSDSRNAIGWLKEKQHCSSLLRTDRNKILFQMLDRAVKWLKENEYQNEVLKWETKAWGENPRLREKVKII